MLQPCREIFWIFGLLAILSSGLLLWGLWPVDRALAIGAALGICLLVAGYLWLVAWGSTRWVRRQLNGLLSGAEPL
jgi:hypothetical protein